MVILQPIIMIMALIVTLIMAVIVTVVMTVVMAMIMTMIMTVRRRWFVFRRSASWGIGFGRRARSIGSLFRKIAKVISRMRLATPITFRYFVNNIRKLKRVFQGDLTAIVVLR